MGFVVLALAAAAVAEPEAAADAYAQEKLPPQPFAYQYGVADAQYVSAYGNYGAYGAYGAYPYNIAKREAEAEADPALIYGSHVAAPFVRTVAAPVVRTVAAPLTTYNYNHVVSPVVHALASHTVTSYNSPTHYTAVSNGVYGPSYVAKNGAVQHVVKREADAEADPAFVYNTVPTYATSNVVAPLASTYAVASPLTTTYNHVASPLTTYNHVATPLTTTY